MFALSATIRRHILNSGKKTIKIRRQIKRGCKKTRVFLQPLSFYIVFQTFEGSVEKILPFHPKPPIFRVTHQTSLSRGFFFTSYLRSFLHSMSLVMILVQVKTYGNQQYLHFYAFKPSSDYPVIVSVVLYHSKSAFCLDGSVHS